MYPGIFKNEEMTAHPHQGAKHSIFYLLFLEMFIHDKQTNFRTSVTAVFPNSEYILRVRMALWL